MPWHRGVPSARTMGQAWCLERRRHGMPPRSMLPGMGGDQMKNVMGTMVVTLMVLNCSAPVTRGGPTMSSDDVLQAGTREITEVHQFFQEWFRGESTEEALSRFDQALDSGFVIIGPGGQALDRGTILEAVRSRLGADPEAVIEVRNVVLRVETETTAVFTYEEWQRQPDGTMRGRLSTVVFARETQAPNGLRWRHVHETWLPMAAPP